MGVTEHSGRRSDTALLERFDIRPLPPRGGRSLVAFLRKTWRVLRLTHGEFRSSVPLSWRHSLRAWRYGFTRRTYFLYNLENRDPRHFFNDYFQSVAMDEINGDHRPACVQKVVFSSHLRSLGVPCPRVLALIVRGRILAAADAAPRGIPWLRDLLGEHAAGLVIKPVIGYEGFGVVILKARADGFEVNGHPASPGELEQVLSRLDNCMVTGFVMQHESAAALYPRTVNTLRLLTLWDDDAGAPFLAAAAQRIGTSRSFPVDNFRGGAGGLSAPVDPGTGELGPGVYRPDSGPVRHCDAHPETGAPIRGVLVPRWGETVAKILEFSARMPFLPVIGWDMVITPDGFSVVEANPGSGLYVFQVHGPLGADERVRKFFAGRGYPL